MTKCCILVEDLNVTRIIESDREYATITTRYASNPPSVTYGPSAHLSLSRSDVNKTAKGAWTPYSWSRRYGHTASSSGVKYPQTVTGNTYKPIDYFWQSAVQNSEAMRVAQARLFDKVRNGVNLSEDIAQWKQTRDMFNANKRALQIVQKKMTKFTPFRSISDHYLEWKFGVKPLIEDYHGSVEVYLDRLHGAVNSFASSRRQQELLTTKSTVNSVAFSLENQKIEYFRTSFARARVFINLRTHPSYARLTTLNPALLGWNLLPWSFVFDWFFDVGGYLRALEDTLYFSGFPGSTWMTSQYTRETWSPVSRFGDAGTYIKLKGRYFKDVYDRTISSQPPQPLRPKFNIYGPSDHAWTALALAIQLVPGARGLTATERLILQRKRIGDLTTNRGHFFPSNYVFGKDSR